MKKLTLIILGILAMTVLAATPAFAAEYPGLLRITEVRDSIVTGVDANGNEWTFLDPCEEWEPDDLCGVIFDDEGTPIIYDDTIKQTRYVGFVELYQ